MFLVAKSKLSPSAKKRQRVDLERQLLDHRHLVFGFALGRAGDAHHAGADEHLVRIAADVGGLVLERLVALLRKLRRVRA